MINFKEWNLKYIGNVVFVSIILVVFAAVIKTFIGPLLVTVLPTIFATPLTLTETLLLLMLVRLHTK